jgi:ABC-type Fe3+-siderophore transport system permease subunit
MPPGFFILIPLLMMLVAFLAGQKLRRRYASDWQGRYRFAQIGLGLAATAWMLFFISNLSNREPFWPREALSIFFLTAFLDVTVYQWHHAKSKAAEERLTMPLQSKHKLSGFFWQAVLILLPVVIMAIIALFSLRQDRVLAEQEAKELGASLAQSLAQAVGDETARQLRDYREANFSLKAERMDRLTLA